MHHAETLVEITRGPIVECIHRGHIVAVESSGRVIARAGNPDYVTYARSSAKPLQAVPVVSSGAAAKFGFTPKEIALLCASHNGELEHVETVARMLEKIGVDPSALQCGAHDPLHKPTAEAMKLEGRQPTAIHNNCSGKHTGMLALAVHLGAPIDTYLDPGHPVQRRMLEDFAQLAGMAAKDVALGVDGCGVPVYGTPLKRLALAFARLGTPVQDSFPEACAQIASAIAENPFMIAGTNRYDTALIEATGGRLIAKSGAEGVFAVALPGEGLGFALKIEDGAQRAIFPAATEALKQLGWLNNEEIRRLESYHEPVVKNWSGTEVGRTTSVFRLEV